MNLAATAPKSVADLRRRELAFIHVAKAQLAISEETYRAMIARFSSGRTQSAGDLTGIERHAVIEHLRTFGAGRPPAKGKGGDSREQASKARALWRSLYQLGEVHAPDDDALAAFVMRQTGIEALRWNRAEDLNKAIEGLKGWCARLGYVPERSNVAGPCQGRYEPGLIRAQWRRLVGLGTFASDGHRAMLDQWLLRCGFGGIDDPDRLPVDYAQEAVRILGRWLRRLEKAKTG